MMVYALGRRMLLKQELARRMDFFESGVMLVIFSVQLSQVYFPTMYLSVFLSISPTFLSSLSI